jgi:hypothetical protein
MVTTPIGAGQFVPVVIPGGTFSENLDTCNGLPVRIEQTLALDGSGTLAQVLAAATARVAADAAATWNTTTLRIAGSCAASSPPCAAMSPRLVALPVFDVEHYEDTRRATGTPEIRIVNFVGLFIRQVTAGAVLGNLATYPGDVVVGAPAVPYIASFLRAGVLHR